MIIKLLPLLILLIANPAHARYVKISWDAVEGATSYTMYWGPVSGGNYKYHLNVGNVTTYQPAINEEVTYLVVSATDATGEGPKSKEITLGYPELGGEQLPKIIHINIFPKKEN